ncbi:dystrophin-related protein 2 [Lates japonicus]|uniref:Dystrophin-related protein 2 n=1 Tax=Lates japonicus TaxID=270547 RepID=A0AAD3NG16_LATJO|nr:dystrophin-related protein 2 [Lates japonicus]
MKSLAGEGTLLAFLPSPHSPVSSRGQLPVSQQSYIPAPSVLSADNKQPNNWARVIEPIKSPSVHWEESLEPVLRLWWSPTVRRSLLLLPFAAARCHRHIPHPGLPSPHPTCQRRAATEGVGPIPGGSDPAVTANHVFTGQ